MVVFIINGEIIDESKADDILKLRKAVLAKLKHFVLKNDDGQLDIESVVFQKFSVQNCIHIMKANSISCSSLSHSFTICDIVIETQKKPLIIEKPKEEKAKEESKPKKNENGVDSYKVKVMKLFKDVSHTSGKILQSLSGSEVVERLATEEECKIIYGENGKKMFCGSDSKGTTINGILFSLERLIQAFPEKITLHYQACVKYAANEIYCDEKKVNLNDLINSLSIEDVENLLNWKGDLCACQTNVHLNFAFVIGNIGFKIENLQPNILHLPFHSILRFGVWSCNQHQNLKEKEKRTPFFTGTFYCVTKFDKKAIWYSSALGKIDFEYIAEEFPIEDGKHVLLKGHDDKKNSFLQIDSIVLDFNSLNKFWIP